MRKSRYSDTQILAILKQNEQGVPVPDHSQPALGLWSVFLVPEERPGPGVPSQKGGLPVCLHMHNQASPPSIALNALGVNSVPR